MITLPQILSMPARKRADADAQSGPDEAFEPQFAQMAFGYVKERAPRLMDFVVGFQLVDRDQGGAKAVGIFGAKVGNAWMYVPCFFLSGKIKGQQLLYLKDSQTFVPNKENWVNQIIARKPYMLGEPASEPNRAGPVQPNFRRIVRPWEDLGKSAQAELARSGIAEWAIPFAVMYAQYKTEPRFGKEANEGLVLDQFLSRRGLGEVFFHQVYNRHPWAKMAFDRWYGADRIGQLIAEARMRKQAKTLRLPTLKKADSRPAVEIYFASKPDTMIGLTEAERELLMRERLLVSDKRPEGAASKAYRPAEFATVSPTQPGRYRLLTPSGGVEEATVFVGPRGDVHPSTLLIIPKDADKATYCPPDRVHAVISGEEDALPGADYAKWFASQSSASIKPGNTYVAIGLDGIASMAFHVSESQGDDTWSIFFCRPSSDQRTSGTPLGETWNGPTSVRLKAPGSRLGWRGNTLHVPEGFKIIDVGDGPHRTNGFQPGRPEDVYLAQKKEANLRLFDVGGTSVRFTTEKAAWECNPVDAFVTLITGFGVRENCAREMLKTAAAEARAGRETEFIVKFADGYGLPRGTPQPGPQVPYGSEPDSYGESFPGGSSATIQPYHEDSIPAVGPEYPPGDPFYQPDRRALGAAQQAAQTGQRDAFDVTMIAAMLKSPIDDSDLGDQVRALDGLGKRLFQLFARYEEYEERYGKNDLPELEDSLDNAFDILGDVVLFLQAKDARGLPGLYSSSAGSGAGGPDVERAARL